MGKTPHRGDDQPTIPSIVGDLLASDAGLAAKRSATFRRVNTAFRGQPNINTSRDRDGGPFLRALRTLGFRARDKAVLSADAEVGSLKIPILLPMHTRADGALSGTACARYSGGAFCGSCV